MIKNKLQKAVEHIKYEIDMLQNTAKALSKANDQFTVNVLLESFAIHAYNLFCFFYRGKQEKKHGQKIQRKHTDIIAEDFIANKRHFRNNRCPKKNLKIIVEKRNKQVAHLTYNRIYRNRKTKPWKIREIYNNMEKTILAFMISLSQERRKWFE